MTPDRLKLRVWLRRGAGIGLGCLTWLLALSPRLNPPQWTGILGLLKRVRRLINYNYVISSMYSYVPLRVEENVLARADVQGRCCAVYLGPH